MVAFKYQFWNMLTQQFLGELPLKAPRWVESVEGATTLEARVVVPEDPNQISFIQQCTEPDMGMVVIADNGVQPFSGYIQSRRWDPATNELTITVSEWTEYLYRLIASIPVPGMATTQYAFYTNQDQLIIADDIVWEYHNLWYGKGIPKMVVTYNHSAIFRQISIDGGKWRSLAAWIDSMAKRDRGFEWDMVFQEHPTWGARLLFRSFYPQRGGVVDGLEFVYGTAGNIIKYEPVEESNEAVVRRQIAVGETATGDAQIFAVDEDPDSTANRKLRFDKVTTWSDVSKPATLASYARSERRFYSKPINFFTFTVSMNAPHAYSYAKGDRCRLRVKDRWLNLEYENVRIVQRDIFPDAQQVVITVDLSDDVLPEVDENGAIT